MPRARTVAALEDVEFCSFCGSGLQPYQATMFTMSYGTMFEGDRRFTDARWFACDKCQGLVKRVIQNLTVSIRADNEREWAHRQVMNAQRLDDLRAERSNKGLEQP